MLKSPHYGVKVVYPALREIGQSRYRFQRGSAKGGKNRKEQSMYYVYILISLTNSKHYIGFTENLERRLSIHNSGKVKSTRAFRPWTIIYRECYSSRDEAYKRERQIKSFRVGRHLRN